MFIHNCQRKIKKYNWKRLKEVIELLILKEKRNKFAQRQSWSQGQYFEQKGQFKEVSTELYITLSRICCFRSGERKKAENQNKGLAVHNAKEIKIRAHACLVKHPGLQLEPL